MALQDELRARGNTRASLNRQANTWDWLGNPAGAQSGLGLRTVQTAPGIDEFIESIDAAQGKNGPAKGFPRMGGPGGSFQPEGSIADNPAWWLQGLTGGAAGGTANPSLEMLPRSMQSLLSGAQRQKKQGY